jgi:hypothetical protein
LLGADQGLDPPEGLDDGEVLRLETLQAPVELAEVVEDLAEPLLLTRIDGLQSAVDLRKPAVDLDEAAIDLRKLSAEELDQPLPTDEPMTCRRLEPDQACGR